MQHLRQKALGPQSSIPTQGPLDLLKNCKNSINHYLYDVSYIAKCLKKLSFELANLLERNDFNDFCTYIPPETPSWVVLLNCVVENRVWMIVTISISGREKGLYPMNFTLTAL